MAAITPEALTGHQVDDHEEHHVSDLTFWKVGAFLAVLTAIEVSTYWWPEGFVTAALLIIMMIIKFVTVALYFMHLKFDAPVLRQVFFAGVILAIAVYLAVLAAMVFFDNSGTQEFDDPPMQRQMPPPATDPPPIIKDTTHHA